MGLAQSVALSDFDADGVMDEARLDGSNLSRRVGLLLSGTGKQTFLYLDPIGVGHGSLFAQDYDNDGSTDLIWTSSFHDAEVVVWLGNGTGKFERAAPYQHGSRSGSNNARVTQPDGSNQDTAIDSDTIRPLDQTINQKRLDQHAVELPSYYPDRVATASPALGQPAGRDPPALLS